MKHVLPPALAFPLGKADVGASPLLGALFHSASPDQGLRVTLGATH